MRGKIITIDFDKIQSVSEERPVIRTLSASTLYMLLAMTEFLSWQTRWENIQGDDQKKAQVAQWAALAVYELMNGEETGDCIDFAPIAPFIEYSPQSPQLETVPDGYISRPWISVTSNDTDMLILGFQVGDIANIGSPVNIADTSNYPKISVNVDSENGVEVEIHIITHPFAGVWLIDVDENPLTLQAVDVHRDLVQFPPEGNVEIVIELDIPYGAHAVNIMVSPVLDAELLPISWAGAALRSVVICGQELCGDDMDVRQSIEQPCMLEKSSNGEDWEAFANLQLCPPKIRQHGGVIEYFHPTDGWTPIDDQPPTAEEGDEFPEPKPRGEDTETDRICAGASNVALVLNMMHGEVVSYTGGLFAPSIAAGIISVLAPAIFFPPSMVVTLPIVVTALSTLALLNTESFTEVIKKQLKCILIENATDNGSGVITFSHGDILNALLTRGASDSMWLALYYYALVIQEGGMNLAGAVDYETSAECPDCDAWCYEWDFTVTDGGFYKPLTEYGQWTSGIGWEGTYAAAMSVEALYIRKDFPSDVNITQIAMYYTKTAGNGANNVNRFRALNNGAIQISTDTNQIGVNLSKTANGNAVCDQLYIDINQGTLGGTVIVRKIQVKGTGVNPFGDDNCA